MVQITGLLDRMIGRIGTRRWSRLAERAPETDISHLRRQRREARRLRQALDRLLHHAEHRLSRPLIGSQAFPVPHDADWSWRPEIWTGPLPQKGLAAVPSGAMLGSEATLFHDCRLSELTLRQLRNTRAEDLSPFALRLDVFRFDGSYLSLALDLPAAAADRLERRHLIRVAALAEIENPLEIFLRLNIKHGPNVEQVVRELPLGQAVLAVEFDLAYTKLNEQRIEKLWLDIIFEGPQNNQIVLRDLTFSRRPRAEL